ncbi:MAG: SDR family NAD(P)-dependent oxidoreductase, partial [Pseudomonadota bacterium]
MAQRTAGGKLEGRVALVTGASRRIGRATVLGLAEAGADVVVHARSSRDEIEAVAEEARAHGARAVTVLGDVADEAAVEAIFAKVEAEYGRLDILVNNAAIRGQAPFVEMSYDQWRATLAVILDGAFLCSRAALRLMVRERYGTIDNLGGMTAHTA